MIQNPKEMLDDYLMGKLSPEQVNNFEAMLQSDPILAYEASIQKDIIAGISDARRAALKARLNNIQIPKQAWYTNLRIVGFAAAAFLLALLAFLLYPNKNVTPAVEQQIASGLSNDVPSNNANSVSASEQMPQNEKAPKEAVASTTKPASKASLPVVDKNKSIATSNITEPNVNQALDNEDAPNKKSDEAETSINPTAATGNTKTLSAETISDNPSFTYHFKRNDSRLTLYGNFTEKAYQVIEINSKTGTNFYMYHNGSYFALPSTGSEIKPLTPLTDEATIKKLANLRKRK
jgi:hypothetical protein